MTEQEPKEAPSPNGRRPAVAGLILILVLVVGGLFLARELRRTSNLQDCVMSGRTNCAPIDSGTGD